MAREPDELVEMRRALGAQLAAYRQAAELSQGQLAIATTVDRTTVAHIEKGRSRADERFWTIADQRCHADGALLTGFRTWQAAKQDHDVRTREADLAAARSRAEQLRAPLAAHLLDQTATPASIETPPTSTTEDTELPGVSAGALAHLPSLGSLAGDVPGAKPDELIDQLARLLGEWIRAMNRRQLIQLLGWTGTTTTAAGILSTLNPDEQERLTHAIAAPNRVDEQVISHLEAILSFCKHQEDALGSRAVLNTMFAQRNVVARLLMECPSAFRARLLSVYSDMSTSIGYYFFDLNDIENAQWYWGQARAGAQKANNADLVIYILCELSHAAYWQGEAHTAINTAAAAQRLLSKTDDPLMQVCVADKSAQAYSIDGQHKACMAQLDKAQDSLTSARQGQAPTKTPAYYYHEGLLASEKSGCLLRLGLQQEAANSAREALALFDSSYVGSLAFCRLFLGNAHLQAGEIAEAAREVGAAAILAAQTHSARLVKELQNTRTRMQPWQKISPVKELDDQLTIYGLATTPGI